MNLTTAVLLASLAVGAGVCSPTSSSAPPAEARTSGVAARLASPAAASTPSEPVAPAAIELSDKGLPAARGLSPRRAPRNALAATEAPKPAPRPAPRKLEVPPPMPEPEVQPAPPPEPADFSDLASGGSAAGNGNAVASSASPPAIVPAREAALARDTTDDSDAWRPSTPVLIASSVGAIGLTLGALGAGFGDGGGDIGFAVAGAGIGAIGMATAGILLLLESGDDDEPKQVRVAVGPAAVSVRGGF
jgi:hypothetical protein